VSVPELRDPVLLVPRAYVGLAAYVDGELVLAGYDYAEASGIPFYVVPLPADRREALVELRVVSRYTQVGIPAAPRVGERAELLANLVARDMPRLALGVAYLAVAVAALALSIQRRERRAWASIALFALSMGAWSLFQTRARQLWMPSLELWFAIWWMVGSLISAGVAYFVDAVFEPGPWRFVRKLWVAFALHAGLSAAALALPHASFYAVAAPLWIGGRVLAASGMVAVLAYVGSRARREVEARMFVGGFAIASVGVLHDIAVSAGVVNDGLLLADVGYMSVVVALIAIVARRIRQMEREVVEHGRALNRFVRERDVLVRDLHDGLGGAVTSLRLLAERGRRVPEDRETTLERIAELADEGMGELRTLMTGFDDLPATYKELAAELRRQGSNLLEAQGVEHRFELELAESELPRPDLARYVALARVHREAIVNALKHAQAAKVTVRLSVDPARLLLEVSDDGGGGTARARRGGRGLASMAARAASIGGTLEVGPGAVGGTTVRLSATSAAD